MTVIETIQPAPMRRRPVHVRPAGHTLARGPRLAMPVCGRPRYRSTGVLMSTAPHRPRPITPATTVTLALLAAVITVWLGLVAQFSSAAQRFDSAATPDRLALVRVEPGETLAALAARVAPGAPAGRVAERIRDLNGLDGGTLVAGQTLIAPVG